MSDEVWYPIPGDPDYEAPDDKDEYNLVLQAIPHAERHRLLLGEWLEEMNNDAPPIPPEDPMSGFDLQRARQAFRLLVQDIREKR